MPYFQSPRGRWISAAMLIQLLPHLAAAPLSSETASEATYNTGSIRAMSAPPHSATPPPTSTRPARRDEFSASWGNAPTSTSEYATQPADGSVELTSVPLLVEPDVMPLSDGSPTPTATWALPPNFSDMSSFSVTAYAAGSSNLAILSGSPAPVNSSDQSGTDTPNGHGTESWDASTNALQLFYPSGSINPGNSPQGGSEFYAKPLDVSRATNASLEYSVYFPPDFNFAKGGKLPGMYGGHKGCSGGNSAQDTRLMWRAGGLGELYLYAPKNKQTPSLCQTKPKSICDAAYGLSIGRGAWKFASGNWTTVRQDVWLNTPGQNDGGFNIWVNGQIVLTASDVRYREHSDSCLQGQSEDGEAGVVPAINAIGLGGGGGGNDTLQNEDWLVSEEMISPISTVYSTQSATLTVTSTMPQLTQFTRFDYSSTSLSSLSHSASTSTVATPSSTTRRKRQEVDAVEEDADPSSQSVDDDDAVHQVASVEAALTDEESAQGATAFVTVPITLMATATTTEVITNNRPVTITPSAVVNTVTDTIVTTQTTTMPSTATVTVTSIETMTAAATSEPSRVVSLRLTDQNPDPATVTMAVNTDPIIVKSPPAPTLAPAYVSPIGVPHSNITSQSQDQCEVGFIGLFFSTFFGGHTSDWASPKDQYSYFKDFKMWVNN